MRANVVAGITALLLSACGSAALTERPTASSTPRGSATGTRTATVQPTASEATTAAPRDGPLERAVATALADPLVAKMLKRTEHRVVLAERRPGGMGNPEATITVAVEFARPVPLREWGREICAASYAGGPFTGFAWIIDRTGQRIEARSPVWAITRVSGPNNQRRAAARRCGSASLGPGNRLRRVASIEHDKFARLLCHYAVSSGRAPLCRASARNARGDHGQQQDEPPRGAVVALPLAVLLLALAVLGCDGTVPSPPAEGDADAPGIPVAVRYVPSGGTTEVVVRVTDTSGSLVDGAVVYVQEPADAEPMLGFHELPDGSWLAEWVQPGEPALIVEAKGYQPVATRVVVRPQVRTMVEVVMLRGEPTPRAHAILHADFAVSAPETTVGQALGLPDGTRTVVRGLLEIDEDGVGRLCEGRLLIAQPGSKCDAPRLEVHGLDPADVPGIQYDARARMHYLYDPPVSVPGIIDQP